MSQTEAPTAAEAAELPDDGTPTTDIVRRGSITEHAVSVMPLLTDEQIRSTWRIAKALAASRMFKDAVQAEQAFAKILIGRDLGISPTQSLMAIDLVKGSIQLRGVLLASFVRRSDSYDYKVREKTHTKARVDFLGYPSDEKFDGAVRHGGRWWEVLGEEEFTIEDAQRAKLVKTDSSWTTHPKNMCFWRAISNGVKTHAPELLGGMPVYVEGELGGGDSGYAQAAPSQATEAAVELPDAITQLFARANALDPREWRYAEVSARLPEPNSEGYQAAVDAVARDLEAWLEGHEPVDADVVERSEQSTDELEALAERWRTDEPWRTHAQVLLSRHADLEIALDEAVADGRDADAEQLRQELEQVEDAMQAAEIPVGWMPQSE